jgi:hypothetical protein
MILLSLLGIRIKRLLLPLLSSISTKASARRRKRWWKTPLSRRRNIHIIQWLHTARRRRSRHRMSAWTRRHTSGWSSHTAIAHIIHRDIKRRKAITSPMASIVILTMPRPIAQALPSPKSEPSWNGLGPGGGSERWRARLRRCVSPDKTILIWFRFEVFSEGETFSFGTARSSGGVLVKDVIPPTAAFAVE